MPVTRPHFDNGLAPVFEANRGSVTSTRGQIRNWPTEIWGWGRTFHEGVAERSDLEQGDEPARWIDRTGKIIFSEWALRIHTFQRD
jgi:hypothetical protein